MWYLASKFYQRFDKYNLIVCYVSLMIKKIGTENKQPVANLSNVKKKCIANLRTVTFFKNRNQENGNLGR